MVQHSSDIIDTIILAVIRDESITDKTAFQKLCNTIYAQTKLAKTIPSIAFIERYHEMVSDARISPSPRVERIFRKRGVRNQSGIAVISLLTKFWGCPGKCIYCPTFAGLPKSYIPDEPAVMRAQMNEFDPVKQVYNRLRSLRITGHCIDKCDVRIIGGTWSVYPKLYQEMFIKAIYDAHTTYEELEPFIEGTSTGTDKFAEFKIKQGFKMRESATLEEAKERNMKSRSRVIGMQIETRPDWINIEEIERLRSYDVTRVEIGYQTTDDSINTLNKRGHGNAESIAATKMLKDAGFKICAHMMPNLLGSTPDIDRKALAEVFNNSDYRPDELKLYPMMVTDKSELTQIWRDGGFTAYDDETLIALMADLLEMVPPYVRLNRVYRDIPAHQILHGSHLANLRQIAEELLRSRGGQVIDTASREVKGKAFHIDDIRLVTREYDASMGKDYMISFEEKSPLEPPCERGMPARQGDCEKKHSSKAPLGKGEQQDNHEQKFVSILPVDQGGQQDHHEQKFVSILPPDKGGQGGLFTKKKYIPYRADLTQKAQQNRVNPTPFEYDMYYKILKVGILEDYKFLRQKPLGNYIVDFYCAELCLAIEIDGDSHGEQESYDHTRTVNLESMGLSLLRFTNREVKYNKEGVFDTIVEWIEKHQNPPTPLIRGEDTELPCHACVEGIENHKNNTSTSLIRGEDTELPCHACVESIGNRKHTTSISNANGFSGANFPLIRGIEGVKNGKPIGDGYTSLVGGEGIGHCSKDVCHPTSDNDDSATLYSLLRLRIPSQYFTGEPHFLPVLEGAALIREIHTFGEQLGIGARADDAIQHQGLGKSMIAEAEKIVKENYPTIKKIAVIAGVGVRPYFEKLGYVLEGGYMMKYL